MKLSVAAVDLAPPGDRTMKEIILASQSPRRRELLGRLLTDFQVMVDDAEEVRIPGEQPEEMVQRLALMKAKNVAEKSGTKGLVIGADTVVTFDGKALGKPKDEEEAFSMLSQLSGREHTVFTGVAVVCGETGKTITIAEGTKVRFRDLTEEEIHAYIASGEPMDKAGAYGIQELGALMISGICGDYFNVVGLPLCRLGTLLKEEFSIDLLVK